MWWVCESWKWLSRQMSDRVKDKKFQQGIFTSSKNRNLTSELLGERTTGLWARWRARSPAGSQSASRRRCPGEGQHLARPPPPSSTRTRARWTSSACTKNSGVIRGRGYITPPPQILSIPCINPPFYSFRVGGLNATKGVGVTSIFSF